ncbi:MAG: hypothetical protein E3J72_08915 [Planctomycetota bacterium]|nr:MAG: hypothetical protein E3J72_08915 [Planctomycetota bacterium]
MTTATAKTKTIFLIDDDYYAAKIAYEELIIPTHSDNRVYEYDDESDEEKRRDTGQVTYCRLHRTCTLRHFPL